MYLHLSPSENNAALERLNTRAFTKIQKWDAVQEYMNAGGYSCADIVVRGPSSPKENCRCLVSFHGCWNEVLTYANKYVSNFCLLSLINIQWIAKFANKYGVEDIVWKSYWDLFPPDYPKISPRLPQNVYLRTWAGLLEIPYQIRLIRRFKCIFDNGRIAHFVKFVNKYRMNCNFTKLICNGFLSTLLPTIDTTDYQLRQ